MKHTRLVLAMGLTAAAGTAIAGPQSFTTARSFAMGGTGVAVAQPASANTSNPAMMAMQQHEWADDFGLILPSINARAADDEKVVDQIDDIQDTIDRINQQADASDYSGIRQSADRLQNQLIELNHDTMRADAGVGISLAVPASSISVGVFTDATLRATGRGNVADSDLALLEAIENDPTLAAGIGDIGDQLNSDGTVIAAAMGEVGVSFAKALELQNNNTLSIGFSPKYVQLRTFEYRQRVSDFEDDDFDAGENGTRKDGFNADVGAAYRFGKRQQWTAGLSVRNVIPMELDSKSGRTYELDPKASVGIAHRSSMHVLTAEADLTRNKAFGYGDDTQWVALGAEFDAFRTVQLRAGVRRNLASNDDNDGIEETTQYTFGLGFSPFGAHLELAGLFSDTEVGAAVELGAAF
ncbi:type IX secretion system membrane protein PorP/SprF [Marinobacter halodurans]|uniref:Type IX secretion system membrane protein PorP/SprF n=1 Tax=Marinobacter halodurans TaxID=2528979 RepID=A0ABY1ZK23_9GAMM|nr:conjugal transfer protein TraF [Marinobacter halodurans]TBW52940.1 type IX secretion system membrane protein PorP/SprF [Marinobacter halodurans]